MTPFDLYRISQQGPLDLYFGMWLCAYLMVVSAGIEVIRFGYRVIRHWRYLA